MAEKDSRIVRLNVGGEVFVSSSTTLLSGGESFFTSLLSGRLASDKDENGAYFIDRSPRYFRPILHYLRTNNLEFPNSMDKKSLQLEAEYYGIQKIADHLKHLEAEEKLLEAEVTPIFPFLKSVGCYVDDDNMNAFMFGKEGKLTHISGVQAFTQALVVQNHPRLPTEWKNDSTHSKSFAVFYEQHVTKGTFKMNSEGNGLVLTLPATGDAAHTLALRQHLATLSNDLKTICITSFSCSAGKCVFMCSHENPHHFHMYRLKKF